MTPVRHCSGTKTKQGRRGGELYSLTTATAMFHVKHRESEGITGTEVRGFPSVT